MLMTFSPGAYTIKLLMAIISVVGFSTVSHFHTQILDLALEKMFITLRPVACTVKIYKIVKLCLNLKRTFTIVNYDPCYLS